MIAGLVALGVWQVERLAWKRDLIARVDSRIHAAPVPAPGPASWGTIDAERHEYLRVVLRGRFVAGRDARVQASTARGTGFWIITPLADTRGFTVLVNRGFVATGDPAPPAGLVTITGLLRLTEPGGGFLRANDPVADRWYSRDVSAIAAVRNLPRAAPYFVDADATAGPRGAPIGGMTVIAFPNNHLVYAITWFALAAMVAGGYLIMMREERRSRRTNDRR
jgi:surfeit locus 1 family protein